MASKGKRPKRLIDAIAYLRTSSATNTGKDKDSDKRQRAAIQAFAKVNGYVIVAEFYDQAVRGSDAIDQRPGFKRLLNRIAGNWILDNPKRQRRLPPENDR